MELGEFMMNVKNGETWGERRELECDRLGGNGSGDGLENVN